MTSRRPVTPGDRVRVCAGADYGRRGLVTDEDDMGCLVVFDGKPEDAYASARWFWYSSLQKLDLIDLIGDLA